jgi:recombination protein RecT
MENEKGLAKIDQFKGIINSQTIRAQVHNSLKEKAGAFMSSMIDLYSGDMALQACDPEKVVLECVKAAVLDLPIIKSLGYAYVVAYKGVPTFIIGYKGLIQLAQRSGLYQFINADVVYDGEFTGKDKRSGEIRLDGEKKSDKVIGYFAYFKLLNGFEKTLYMTKEEVYDHMKKYSPASASRYSPWNTEFDKMACKTVLRQLLGKYGPTSSVMQKAEDADERVKPENTFVNKKQMIDITVDEETGEVIEPSSDGE